MSISKILVFSLSFSFAAGAAIAQEQAASGPSPKVTILEPADGAEFSPGQDVTVKFSVENFLFVDFKNNAEPFPGGPNAGHAHLWLDPPKGQEYNHDTGRKLLSTDPVNLGGLSREKHTVTMELTQNDHKPFDPPVRTTATFYVGKAGVLGALTGGSENGWVLVALLVLAGGGFIYWFIRLQKIAKTP